jgi:hypothetical protein
LNSPGKLDEQSFLAKAWAKEKFSDEAFLDIVSQLFNVIGL